MLAKLFIFMFQYHVLEYFAISWIKSVFAERSERSEASHQRSQQREKLPRLTHVSKVQIFDPFLTRDPKLIQTLDIPQ